MKNLKKTLLFAIALFYTTSVSADFGPEHEKMFIDGFMNKYTIKDANRELIAKVKIPRRHLFTFYKFECSFLDKNDALLYSAKLLNLNNIPLIELKDSKEVHQGFIVPSRLSFADLRGYYISNKNGSIFAAGKVNYWLTKHILTSHVDGKPLATLRSRLLTHHWDIHLEDPMNLDLLNVDPQYLACALLLASEKKIGLRMLEGRYKAENYIALGKIREAAAPYEKIYRDIPFSDADQDEAEAIADQLLAETEETDDSSNWIEAFENETIPKEQKAAMIMLIHHAGK